MLPPETAHRVALNALRFYPAQTKVVTEPITSMGLQFPNRVGLAAGLDKNGAYINALAKLGFGHLEIGTVTPKPQLGNPKPRLFRLPQYEALINRLGFNNLGVDQLVENVKRAKFDGILGINIGKNKETPNEIAYQDYLICLKKVYEYASYITVNVSSPNTPHLRELQEGKVLLQLLDIIFEARERLAKQSGVLKPIVLKIAPDMTEEGLNGFIESVCKYPLNGIIATNTTVERFNIQEKSCQEEGGLSGKPLFERSTRVIQTLREKLPREIALIGVGGIDSYDSAEAKMNAGADLVQIYTGFIYKGPELIREIASNL